MDSIWKPDGNDGLDLEQLLSKEYRLNNGQTVHLINSKTCSKQLLYCGFIYTLRRVVLFSTDLYF